MSEYVRVMGVSELPPVGEAREAVCGERPVCIANSGGELTAMGNVCPHRGGPLGQGIVEDGKLICPWHAWAFDVKTGVAVHTPQARVDVYEIKVAGDDVLVKL
ncbi:MAG TPA: Rieske (2Fe-2S) protein [Acidobacteriaceae bacterium]|nr:Rieske (2Fe-2S) protein [Acidobacteriaceae bacterium]